MPTLGQEHRVRSPVSEVAEWQRRDMNSVHNLEHDISDSSLASCSYDGDSERRSFSIFATESAEEQETVPIGEDLSDDEDNSDARESYLLNRI